MGEVLENDIFLSFIKDIYPTEYLDLRAILYSIPRIHLRKPRTQCVLLPYLPSFLTHQCAGLRRFVRKRDQG